MMDRDERSFEDEGVEGTLAYGGDELTVLIADDETLARRRHLELLRGREGVRVAGECPNGRTTLASLREVKPDILFLDVQMPGLDGFEVLARLEPEARPVVIFSTAYDEYALAAFDVHAVDYLLKPYSDARWEEAFRRAMDVVRAHRIGEVQEQLRGLLNEVVVPGGGAHSARSEQPSTRAYERRLAVPGRTGVSLVDVQALDWVEAAGDYARLHVGEESHLLRATMAELEGRLDPGEFVRIHRSAIVRLDRVQTLRSDSHGDYLAVLEGGTCLRVGRTYRDAVLRRVGLRR